MDRNMILVIQTAQGPPIFLGTPASSRSQIHCVPGPTGCCLRRGAGDSEPAGLPCEAGPRGSGRLRVYLDLVSGINMWAHRPYSNGLHGMLGHLVELLSQLSIGLSM